MTGTERDKADPGPSTSAGLGVPARVVLSRRIEWMDTDAAGIYHYTTVFRLIEAAEAELHTRLGIDHLTFGFTPRLNVSADFLSPLVFNDRVDVELEVVWMGRSSLAYGFCISKEGKIASKGEVTVCYIDQSTKRAAPWPEEVRDALAVGLPQQPASDQDI